MYKVVNILELRLVKSPSYAFVYFYKDYEVRKTLSTQTCES